MAVNGHPNATLAAVSGSVATVATYVTSLFGWVVPSAVAVAGASLFTSMMLFLGKNGLSGVCRIVWRGGA
jgi:hypothetical protein